MDLRHQGRCILIAGGIIDQCFMLLLREVPAYAIHYTLWFGHLDSSGPMRGRNRRGFRRLKNQSGGIVDKKFTNRIIFDVINMITPVHDDLERLLNVCAGH